MWTRRYSRPVAAMWLITLTAPPLLADATAAPDWAFPGCPQPPDEHPRHATEPVTMPGSSRTLTRAELSQSDVTADWFPDEHAPMPAIVATQPGKAGCGYCHLPDGAGRPENAKLSGLPADYIVAQVRALHSGDRQLLRPEWAPSKYMVEFSSGLAAKDIEAAARYFAAVPRRSYVRVVEAKRVPSMTARCYVYARSEGASVLLGTKILEVPVAFEHFEMRDPHSEYIAYVPVGSIERGRRLASGDLPDRTLACAACHGEGLNGQGSSLGPPLAGQFPGYLFRQLYGFKSGTRAGTAAAPMLAVVASLTEAEMVDLAAYAASLRPQDPGRP